MSKFGIKKDLQAKAGIPINLPLPLDKPTPFFSKGYSFPLVVIDSVSFNPKKETTDRNTDEVTYQPVLEFVIKDHANPEKRIIDTYYPIDEMDDKFEVKHEGLQKSIKHYFEETVGAEHFNEEEWTADSYAELFEKAAKNFAKYTVNKTVKGKDGAEDNVVALPIYKQSVFYFKSVIYNGRVKAPMYPNFIQKAFKSSNGNMVQVPCELAINKNDAIVDKSTAKPKEGGRDNTFGMAPFGMNGGMDMGLPAMDFPDQQM